jgi:hypothetical protein
MRFDTESELLGLWSWQDTIAGTLTKRLKGENAAWEKYGKPASIDNMYRGYVSALGAGISPAREATATAAEALARYITAAVSVPLRAATQFVILLTAGGIAGTIPYKIYDPAGFKAQDTAKKAVTGEKSFMETITPKFGPGLAMIPLLAIGGLLAVGYILKQAAPVAREVKGILR